MPTHKVDSDVHGSVLVDREFVVDISIEYGRKCLYKTNTLSSRSTICLHATLDLARTASLRKSPWFRADDLALAVGPEVDNHSRDVVDCCVGGLVEKSRGQCRERKDCQTRLKAAVEAGARERLERELERHHAEAHDEIDDLQNRQRLDRRVERLGQEVEEDFGPEEALKGSANLIRCCCYDDEARPVVLDESTHFGGCCRCREFPDMPVSFVAK